MSVLGLFRQISPRLLEMIKKYPDIEYVFYEISESSNNYEVYEALQREKIAFEQIKDDLTIIINDFAENECLDIGKFSDVLTFYLTGEWGEFGLAFLTASQMYAVNINIVNAVLGGKRLREDLRNESTRYLTSSQVKEVAECLSKIREENFCERLQKLNKIARTEPNLYFWGKLKSEHEQTFLELSDDLLKYYQDAAAKGNAMLINVA